jgi:antitoxin (DNA-binding transcriptional repressor) of toxin-antitoxin stability system
MDMKAVGIKVLKDNLSRYLRCVREGETVYVTDRDTVIAEIHRPVGVAGRVDPWQSFLNDEERRGTLQPARASGGPSLVRLASDEPLPGPAPDLQRLLADIKSE